jgi:LuxR family transcriptional regulator, maltose regulon positive regulatory protein
MSPGGQWPEVRTAVTDTSEGRAPPSTLVTVPEPPAWLVQAPRLNRILDAGTLGPVTVLSAPAGWGKTVALSSWLTFGEVAPPVVWVTFEPHDARNFWSRLDDALALAVIPYAQRPPPATSSNLDVLAEWLRGLPGPLRLVLDDFHFVEDPAVMDGLDLLVRHSAGRLRLVIATRHDLGPPLHRWRLRGELTELRLDELSFTLAETEQLLAWHGIHLPAAELRSLHHRTEGWPGGIQLAALAVRGQKDATQAAAAFSGEQETISQYLDAEVFASLSPRTQDLFLRTSVVDRFCADLANALTGRRDCEQRLADLRHAGAFLMPIESQPTWYRFHRMFGEMLRAKLRRSPDLCQRMHERAAVWHTRHGLPGIALRHAVASGDEDLANSLLSENWPELALSGAHEAGLPLPKAESERGATRGAVWETLANAADRLDISDLIAADKLIRFASRRQFLREPDPPCPVDLAAASLRLARARLGDDRQAVVSIAEEMLELIERGDAGDDGDAETQLAAARTIAMTALGIAHLGLGHLQSGGDSLAEAAADGEAESPCPLVVCTGGLALAHAVHGDLGGADQSALAALAWGPCRGQHPCLHREPAYLALAVVHYERNRAQEAIRFLDLADCARDLGGDTSLAAWGALIRSWVLLASGDLGAADAILLEGRRQRGCLSPQMERWFVAAEAEVRTACGGAHSVPDRLMPMLDDAEATRTPLAVALAHAYLHENDVHAAARVMPQWSDENKADPLLALRLEAGLVEAVTASRLGDAPRAAGTLERVLGMAEPQGFRRVFVTGGTAVRDLLAKHLESGTAFWSFVRDLVDTPSELPVGPHRSPSGPDEPLTDRELTVLRYLQSVLSNEEIASKLFLSVNTVKTHVRNIYRKLGVSRRREAVQRARELHLL